jgi:predicted DNA-binding ribbon-helix-helix protein
MNDDNLTEEIEIELPDEDYKKLQEIATEKGVSVDRLINDMLKEAVESGELERIIKEIQARQ